jgi:hypothetical protein
MEEVWPTPGSKAGKASLASFDPFLFLLHLLITVGFESITGEAKRSPDIPSSN